MNKHRYRIIFNQTRGMLMVVAESARRQGKAGESNGPGGSAPARRAAFGLSALSLGVLLFTGAISWATPLQAQIIADRTAPGNRQASVLNSANGVLQVNIQTPSATGVSRNVFSRFDVPASGTVLNNSRTGAQTRLGGLVQGNPWLATGTARVIVSEVNATSPSQLRGYVEVGGDRAEVVIANPAGIVCDGCGFINASRSTLTTGTPIIGNDGLTGFRVQTGGIVVQGAGLDASSTDYTQLIARAVELNAGIWAQDLRINTGAAEVSADANQATPLAGSGPAPAFALDVAALGGMYANKITLVGSEAGLGMRNAGHLGASAGNVIVTTAGWLENAGQIESSTRLHIAAAGPIGNSGTLLAGTDASLSTPDNVTLGGTLIAQGDVSVAATGNTAWIEAGAASSLIAGRRPDGTLGTTGTLQLTAAGQVGAHGYNLAGNQLQVTGSAIDLQGGQLAAPTILLQASTLGIDLSASHITAQDALIGSSPGRLSTARAAISAQSLRLDAHSLDNTSGELLQFGTDEMRLQLPGELTNRGGRIASNATTLRLGASTLDNGNGNIEHAGTGSLEIRSQTLAGSGGQILSNGLLDLHSAGLVLDAATTRAAQLAITADSFSHRDGQLLQTGSGAGQIITTGSLDNQRGQIASNGALTLSAGSLDNRAGDILTSGTQSLTAYLGTNLDNRDGGRLRTGGNLDIQARSLDNSGGELSAGASLGITATQTFTNIAGLAASNGTGQITTGLLDNQHGQITSNGTLTVTAGSLDNRAGDILTSGTQSLTAYLGTDLDNRDSGRLRAGGKLDLQARSLDNSGGELSAGASLGVTATQTFTNIAGLVTSTGNLAVTTGALDNTRGNIQSSQASVRIDSGTVDNTRGQLFAATDLTLGAQNVLNPDGNLYAGHALSLALTGTLIHGGTLAAGQDVTVRARGIDASTTSLFAAGLQSDGSLGGSGVLTLGADETLIAHGRNLAASSATLSAASLDLSASQTAARAVTLQASTGPLDTRRATVSAAEALTLSAGGLLDNRQGNLGAARLDVQAHSLDNTGGELLQFGTDEMRLQLPGELTNRGGRIASNATTLRLGASTLDNGNGNIEHAGTGSLEIRSQNLAGSDGQILSNGLLDLHSAGLVLDAATTRAAQLSISADTFRHRDGQLLQTGTGAGQITTRLLDNQHGQISSNGALTVTAGSLDNRAGDILTSGTQNLTTRLDTHLDNRDSGRLRAGGKLDIQAHSLDNSGGELSAGASLGVTATQTFTNIAGLIASTGGLALTTGALDNTRGNIQSSQASVRIDSGTVDNTRGQLFAAADLTLGAQNVLNLDGNLYAGHALSLALTGTLIHSGTLAAGQDVTVRARSIDANTTSLFAAGLQSDGSLSGSGAVTLGADETLIAHGRNLAASSATLSAASLDLSASQTAARAVTLQARAGLLDTRRATVSADEALTLSAGGLLDNRQGNLGAARLDIQAHSLDNTSGELLQFGTNEMRLQLPGELTNRGGRIASNATTLRLGASTLDNGNGNIEHAGTGSLEIRSQTLAGSGGQILSNGLLDLHSAGLVLDAATTRAAQLAITADSFSHRDGQLLQTGSGAGKITTTGSFDNQHGGISSNGTLTVTAGSIDNRAGDILTSGTQSLTAHLDTNLDNRDGGRLRAGGNLDIQARGVDNSSGELSAGATLGIALSNTLTNTDGFLVGRNGANVQVGSLDNTRGTLAAILGSAGVQVGTTLDNRAGRIGARQLLTVSAARLDNRAGTLAASSLLIDTGPGKVDNQGGQLVASGAQDAGQLTLDSGLVDNTGGLIQARGRLTLDTRGQALINRETASAGGILGGATMSVRSAALDNSQGYIGSQSDLEIRATMVDNTHGLIASSGGIDLLADTAHNQEGRLFGVGDLGLALSASFDNTAGLVRAGGRLALDASSVINTRTQGDGLGLEGREVRLSIAQLNNLDGALRADTALSVTSGGSIDNTRGLISSLGTLTLTDPAALGRTLAITHTDGTLLAGTRLSVDALSLGGDGQLLSGGDLAVRLAGSFDNRGELRASGNARLDTAGTLTNRATLAAGGTLNLGVSALDNRDGGEIRAAQIRLDTPNALTNRGLIDADNTLITSPLVDNLGSGRIYGTRLAIAATTLNNLPEAGLAPVIAARERLDLGIGTLENRDHALIFSAGDMAIGASLDARHLASGQAEHLTNASATIEALGQLTLAARRTDNVDAHFSTHTVETATESHLEYAFNGSPVHYDESAIKITYRFGDDGVRTLNVLAPDSAGRELKSENFSAFRFTRTVREEQILNADPGRIVAGGNLVLSGDSLINDKSQILAGGTLSAVLGSLSNIAASGLRTTVDVGTVTNYWRHERSGTDSQGNSTAAYLPAPGVESLTLASPLFAQGSSLGGSTPVIPSGVPASLTPTAQGAGRASTGPRNQAIIEVAASLTPTASVDNTGIAVTSNSGSTPTTTPPITLRDASASTSPVTAPAASIVQPAGGTTTSLAAPLGIATLPTDDHPGALPGPAVIDSSVQNTLVRSLAPALTLPDNRLFSVRPEPGARYLVETDPRFTDRRTWLDSSFMLNALSIDSAATQKRLGDGFHEQQRVREQVAQLTGRRFLDGYANDEVQYQDLMRAGLAYAKAWNLIPGVALSAAQMAQLTTDIVWLVDSPVTLADGSVQHVLAPQVYVRVRDGDIDGSGALLSGNGLNLNLGGTLLNSGTLTGRQWVDLSADTLTNLGGRISGNNVALNARLDLQNLGGRLEATQALDMSAGRDINVASTTRSSTSEQGSRTQRDRLAGLYVSGGTLTVHAGRDIQFDAAEILNSAPTAAGPAGTTTLAAGRDLKLGTLTESAAQRIVWDGKNQRSEAGTKEIGSVVRTQGDLQLIAGQDMNLRAASLTSKGALTLNAGNDITLSAGQMTQTLDEAHVHQSQAGGLLGSRQTVSTQHQDARSELTITTLSGRSVSVGARRDLTVEASQLTADAALTLGAGRDVHIVSAETTATTFSQIDRVSKALPGQKSVRQTVDTQQVTQLGSALRGASVDIVTGNNLIVSASRLDSPGEVRLTAGNQIAYLAATNLDARHETVEKKDNRLTVANLSGLIDNGWQKDTIKSETSTSIRTAAVTHIQSEAEVLSQSGGNTTLQGTEIRAGSFTATVGRVNDQLIDPSAQLKLQGVIESTTTSHTESSHSFLWQSMAGQGSTTESLKMPEILLVPAQGATAPGPTLKAAGGIVVDAVSLPGTRVDTQKGSANPTPAANAKPLASTVVDLKAQAETLAQQPGMAWLRDLTKRTDVDWQTVRLVHNNWDYAHSGLTKEGGIVVAIVVAVLTYGAGSAAAGTTTAAVEGGAATAAAEGAAATAVAGGGATTTTWGGITLANTTAQGITTYTAAGAALNTGFTTLATQTASSLLNNKGDVGKTLSDLGSEESVKQVVASMLSGAVGGYFGDTKSLESVVAKTAAGCAATEISGGKCAQGAAIAGTVAGFAWAADAMTKDQIANSQQFKGVCIEGTDNCADNFTRRELGGGRWDLAKICRTGKFECTVRADGFVSIAGEGIESSGKPIFDAIEDVFKSKGETLLSPMGGSQGSLVGYLKILGIGPGYYEKDSFWGKLVETYGGPHDWLNSFSAYDTVNASGFEMRRINFDGSDIKNALPASIPRAIGNIRPDYGAFATIMNIVDIPIATPFALGATLDKLPPGSFQNIQNVWQNLEQQNKKEQP